VNARQLVSSAPRVILKRIVNFDLVVPNEAIRSLFHFAETTKDGLYFCGRAFTADKDTQTESIEVVRLRLYDVCRGSQQSAGAIKLKGQGIGAVAMTKRIGCIADRCARIAPRLCSPKVSKPAKEKNESASLDIQTWNANAKILRITPPTSVD